MLQLFPLISYLLYFFIVIVLPFLTYIVSTFFMPCFFLKGERMKNIGVVDSEYIVHHGLPTLGADDEKKV